ncbi:hypothetical protein SAMN05518801_101329 [Novosphingobium sp. CF614]|uniref:hypothetical protein n=1 Tax=Novosphingobium sp. CF614 TaxID=1884364 RepID=UPI0008F12AD1|nr:hypothetical protein [Novosphingobium sp. CF614]SFF76286.1 hypothetical protein SAMN05518801_101329 [Novosphingobium sp. CF614]
MTGTMDDKAPNPQAWAARLRDFVQDCVASTPCEELQRVREAALLFQRDGAGGVDPVVLEAMLACGAAESAVLALIGPEAVFMLSRGGSSTCLVTMIVTDGPDGPDGVEEVAAEGSTLALALLAAYATGLLTGFDRNGPTPFQRPTSRLH